MPTVNYPVGGTVKATGLPRTRFTVKASDEAFGSKMGESLEGAAETLDGSIKERQVHLKKMTEEADKAAAKDLETQFNEEYRNILHDPEVGFYSKQGRDSYESFEPTQKKFKELKNKYQNKSKNDQQRQMFAELSQKRIDKSLDAMARHSGQQFRGWLDKTSEARVEESIRDADLNFTDTSVINRSLATGVFEIREIAQRNGWSKEQTDLKLLDFQSDLQATIISRMAQHNPIAAEAYFQAHKAELNPGVRTKYEEALSTAAQLGKVQRLSDQIMANSAPPEVKLAKARKTKDPALRKALVSDLKTRINEEKTMEDLADRRLIESASDKIVEGRRIRDLSVEELRALGPSGLSQLQNYVDKVAKGETIVTDLPTYFQLEDLALRDPQQFAKANLKPYVASIEKGDLSRLMSLQRSIISKSPKDKQTFSEVQGTSAMVTSILKSAKIKPDTEEGMLFRRRVQEELYTAETDAGKKLDPRGKQALVDRLFQEVVTEGGLWNTTQRVYEIEVPPGVPASEVDELASVLHEMGQEVSQENIKRLYEYATNGDK